MAVKNMAAAQALADSYIDLHPAEVASTLEPNPVEQVVGFLEDQTPHRA